MKAVSWLMGTRKIIAFFFFCLLQSTFAFAQEDMLKLLSEQDTLTGKEFVNPAFKTNRIINLQTAEVIKKKMLDIKITQR